MRRAYWVILALAGAFVGRSPAAASEWWSAGSTADLVAFVDTATLVRAGSTVEFWQYDIRRRPIVGIKSSKRRKRLDCKSLETELIQMVDYDEAGRAGPPLVYARLAPDPIPAQSPADAGAYRFACAAPADRTTGGARPVPEPAMTAAAIFGQSSTAGR